LEKATDGITLAVLAGPEEPGAVQMPEVRIGVFTPTHNRPDLIRALVLQMAMQVKKPDILCIHQNGDPESYQWVITDLALPFKVI
jgi:hypothetical protein